MERRDRAGLAAELAELAGDYRASGIAGLREESSGQRYFLRLTDAAGRQSFRYGRPPAPPADAQRERLPDGDVLELSRTSAQRAQVLAAFRRSMAAVLVLALLLGLAGGAAATRNALRPLRDFVGAVKSILAGRSEVRLPRGGAADELDELGELFNRLLDRIQRLVGGMKEALDAVGHDLRTPMARLRASAEAALSGPLEPSALRDALADCAEEAQKVSETLRLLMDISEAETGTLAIRPQPVDLGLLVDEAVELYQGAAEEKGVLLAAVPGSPARASCDPGRMRQVAANLVDNAVKYTPAGGRVTVSARRDGEAAVLRVEDSGIGIPEAELPRIWERLFRGAQARRERGLGLGLSLVKAVVEAHGGRVDVESSPGRGCAFSVRLPYCRD